MLCAFRTLQARTTKKKALGNVFQPKQILWKPLPFPDVVTCPGVVVVCEWIDWLV